MADDWTLYFNPKCGSCRKALDLLKGRNVEPALRFYLKEPPTVPEMEALLKKLNMEPADLARKKEPVYKELGLGSKPRSREAWVKILVENPILIERPIAVRGRRAVVARPPEKVETLFS